MVTGEAGSPHTSIIGIDRDTGQIRAEFSRTRSLPGPGPRLDSPPLTLPAPAVV